MASEPRPDAPKPPAWVSLGAAEGPHWDSLDRDYVPAALLQLVPRPPSLVLDVGCFCGATGGWLKSRYPGARVVGIEPSPKAAAVAATRLDAVLTGKLGEVDLQQARIGPATLDLVVLADVLEHMYDPWRALLSLKPLLKPDGVVLASIPNVRNLTILDGLAQGDFPYGESGLLDIAHIRFFSWSGVQRLFGDTGFRLEEVHRVLDSRWESLRAALGEAAAMDVDTQTLRLKHQSPEQVGELVTLQYCVRAAAA